MTPVHVTNATRRELAAQIPRTCPTCGSDDPHVCAFVQPEVRSWFDPQPHEHGNPPVWESPCCSDPFHRPVWSPG